MPKDLFQADFRIPSMGRKHQLSAGCDASEMYFMVVNMFRLIEWFKEYDNALAVLATVGVAVFLYCCLECTNCSRRDKDEFFRHRKI